MKQNNETEKSFSKLKENAQADARTKKKRTLTPMRKTELKPPTREPKKSVFRARVKEYFNP
ncbi:hypothetical protein HpNP55_10760 [Helicobacter pylori]